MQRVLFMIAFLGLLLSVKSQETDIGVDVETSEATVPEDAELVTETVEVEITVAVPDEAIVENETVINVEEVVVTEQAPDIVEEVTVVEEVLVTEIVVEVEELPPVVETVTVVEEVHVVEEVFGEDTVIEFQETIVETVIVEEEEPAGIPWSGSVAGSGAASANVTLTELNVPGLNAKLVMIPVTVITAFASVVLLL
jgi:hypothetical protein